MTSLEVLRSLALNRATPDALALRGATEDQLLGLCDARLIRRHLATMAVPKGMTVTWFIITDDGRAALLAEWTR